jgi:hypothetical protein
MSSALRLLALRRAVTAALLVLVLLPAGAYALPPDPAGPAKTLEKLRLIPVSQPLSMAGYDRGDFPHWSRHANGCTTRKLVLRRDGQNVVHGEKCKRTTGRWRSFYDGLTTDNAREIDIDHVVPLANAWRSGARDWSLRRRGDFANDLENSQLIAVSASSNRSKQDSGPDEWVPPRRDAWCLYASWWVQVKREWALTVVRAEREALVDMIKTC